MPELDLVLSARGFLFEHRSNAADLGLVHLTDPQERTKKEDIDLTL